MKGVYFFFCTHQSLKCCLKKKYFKTEDDSAYLFPHKDFLKGHHNQYPKLKDISEHLKKIIFIRLLCAYVHDANEKGINLFLDSEFKKAFKKIFSEHNEFSYSVSDANLNGICLYGEDRKIIKIKNVNMNGVKFHNASLEYISFENISFRNAELIDIRNIEVSALNIDLALAIMFNSRSHYFIKNISKNIYSCFEKTYFKFCKIYETHIALSSYEITELASKCLYIADEKELFLILSFLKKENKEIFNILIEGYSIKQKISQIYKNKTQLPEFIDKEILKHIIHTIELHHIKSNRRW